MTLEFRLVESKKYPLWDFGWFDANRFEINGGSIEHLSWQEVVRRLFHNPIYQRALCTSPDPWGNGGSLHGPFPIEKLQVDWCQRVPGGELQSRLKEVFESAEFYSPPSTLQRQPVEEWIATVESRGDEIFSLQPPLLPDVKVDWSSVWTVFHEFICLARDRSEVHIAIIGYD